MKAMNEIAHALGKKTVAEFVEDKESFFILTRIGVDYCQGYYLGRPVIIDLNDPDLPENLEQFTTIRLINEKSGFA